MRGCCVFDIDGTLKPSPTCGSNRDLGAVRRLITAAQKNKFGIAINTARSRISERLRQYLLSNFGIDVDHLKYGAVQVRAVGRRRKVKALERIHQVYGILRRKDVVFFDDVQKIVDAANAAGFYGICVAENSSYKACAVISEP